MINPVAGEDYILSYTCTHLACYRTLQLTLSFSVCVCPSNSQTDVSELIFFHFDNCCRVDDVKITPFLCICFIFQGSLINDWLKCYKEFV